MFSLPKRHLAALLLLSCAITSAKEHGLYWSWQGGPEIWREAHYSSNANDPAQSSEWEFLPHKHSNPIVEQLNKALIRDLYKALHGRDIANSKLPILETGIGYYFQCIVPLALELKVMAKDTDNHPALSSKPNSKRVFFYPNAKIFLPISSKIKLYARLAKLFRLTQNEIPSSLSEIDPQSVWMDIKETVLDTTPQIQWDNSITLLGMGFTRKLSSKLELDFSLNGYAREEAMRIYFNACLGINYLFK